MKEHPILFSTEMVQAIHEGRKVMTRRIVKPRTQEDFALMINMEAGINVSRQIDELIRCSCPYGSKGDILWVRESHFRFGMWKKNGVTKTGKQKWRFYVDTAFPNIRYLDDPPYTVEKNSHRSLGWYKRSSLFMEKFCSRIKLKITDIRVERLQDISEEDAIKEGVKGFVYDGCWVYTDYNLGEGTWSMSAVGSFCTLWQEINGIESWNSNPWVWRLSFEKIAG